VTETKRDNRDSLAPVLRFELEPEESREGLLSRAAALRTAARVLQNEAAELEERAARKRIGRNTRTTGYETSRDSHASKGL
jgi:hypothetical protein